MTPSRPSTDDLARPAPLTVAEMAELIAAEVSRLPTVSRVSVGDDGDVAVDLVRGMRIEVQAIPVAQALNASTASRRRTLDELMLRCA
jgi:hypothetical protein